MAGEPVKLSDIGTPIGESITLGDFVSAILSNAVVIAGIVLLFILLFGGVSMVIGAGQDDPGKVAQGKKAATAAIIGFGLVFVSYWLYDIISLLAGNFFTFTPAT